THNGLATEIARQIASFQKQSPIPRITKRRKKCRSILDPPEDSERFPESPPPRHPTLRQPADLTVHAAYAPQKARCRPMLSRLADSKALFYASITPRHRLPEYDRHPGLRRT